jgi:hypothetical protein
LREIEIKNIFAQYMTKEPIELEANLYVQNWLMYKKNGQKTKLVNKKKVRKEHIISFMIKH